MFTVLAAILFVLSSGLIYNERFRRHRVLVGLAASIAILSSIFLLQELPERLGVRSKEGGAEAERAAAGVRKAIEDAEAARKVLEERNRALLARERALKQEADQRAAQEAEEARRRRAAKPSYEPAAKHDATQSQPPVARQPSCDELKAAGKTSAECERAEFGDWLRKQQ
jgi:hypothetical protein